MVLTKDKKLLDGLNACVKQPLGATLKATTLYVSCTNFFVHNKLTDTFLKETIRDWFV